MIRKLRLWEWIAITLLVLGSFVFRWRYAGIYAESWDAVDFALALLRYDIFDMQPHFPGYPLYILLAHAFFAWTGEPVTALTLLAAFFGSLSVGLWHVLVRMWTGNGAVIWFSTLLFAANPLLGLASVQPMSEALGLFFVLFILFWVSLCLQINGSKMLLCTHLAAVFFSLLLGVRISYFPIGFVLLIPLVLLYRQRENLFRYLWNLAGVALTFLASLAAWLVPTAATEGGLLPYLALGRAFAAGHFTEWGGTVLTAASGWEERLWEWGWNRFLLNGGAGISQINHWESFLTLFFLILFAVTGAIAAWRYWSNHRNFLLLAALSILPYAAWIYWGQNADKARHILPLLPWLILLTAYGWSTVYRFCTERFKQSPQWRTFTRFLLGGAGGFLLLLLWNRQLDVLSQHQMPSPSVQLVHYVSRHYAPEETYLYTWEEQRLFDYYAPDYHTERLKSFNYFRQSLLVNGNAADSILLTNAVLDGFGPSHPLRSRVRLVTSFEADPFLYPTYHKVELYELPKEQIPVITSPGFGK